MTKQELIDKTIQNLYQLPDKQIEEVSDFCEFLQKKHHIKKNWTAKELMQLPYNIRNQILKQQMQQAESLYIPMVF